MSLLLALVTSRSFLDSFTIIHNISTFGPAHVILVLTAYAQKPFLNAHTDVSSGVRGLYFGLSL